MWDYVLQLRAKTGLTIFMTTHYMEEAEYCDRIAIIDGGRIVALDTPAALKRMVGNDVVSITTPEPRALAAVIQALFQAPFQDGRATASRRHGPVRTDDEPAARTVYTPVRGGAGGALLPGTVKTTRDAVAVLGSACLDDTKVLVSTARVLDVCTCALSGPVHSRPPCAKALDAWLAFLYRAWYGSEKLHALAPAVFASDAMAKVFEQTKHGGVLAWNLLLQHCAGSPVRAELLASLFQLFQPAFGKAVTRVLTHAHVLVLAGLFAHMVVADREWVQPFRVRVSSAVTDATAPVPSWLEGLDVLTPAMWRFWNSHDMLWQDVQCMLSERRLVAELQAQLPNMLLSRGASAFSDRLVFCRTILEEIALEED